MYRKRKGHPYGGRPAASGFRGVTLIRKSNKWVARIYRDCESHHIGVFETPEEAARAYDEQAIKWHGPTAMLNFPRGKDAN